MNFAANEISKGKNLEINLPRFGSALLNTFNNYSFVKLSMNYYTYYEMISESANKNDELVKLIDKFNECISRGVLYPVMGAEQVAVADEIVAIRNSVIETMKGLTSLADIFNIFEYVLNRIEYKFKDSTHIVAETDDDFANSVISYILSDKDNVVMNTKISETVRQLPVRMVKSKFFELLHTGLMVYKESEKQSVEDFLYMIKTSSMLLINDNAFTLSSDIKEIYESFIEVDYLSIDEEKFDELMNKLRFATTFIEENVNKYMMFAELINDAYIIILSNHYKDKVPKEHDACIKIIETLYNRFNSDNNLNDDIELEECFIELEGKQEDYHRYYSNVLHVLEMIFETYMQNVNALAINSMYNVLDIVKQLASGSLFVEFNNTLNDGVADTAYIENVFSELKDEYTKFFKENNKMINRAVMAHVLSSLPIFFNNIDEVKKYITTSISGCNDEAEKLACYEIFHSLMEE